jgi:glycosyltransferase involved in cell wall biosynthesis
MKFSIYSIIKNEEAEIRQMLETVKDADELVVCIDDTTTDNSEAIAREYTDKVFKFKWEDDFAKAKNEAASHCTGDWLMSIDGDCRLQEGGVKLIKDLINMTKQDVINVSLNSIQWKNNSHRRGKIYRNNGKIFYQGMAHEDLNAFGYDHESGILPVIYYGYSVNHAKDPDRYLRILTKQLDANPKSSRTLFYLSREYFYKKDYGTAINLFREYLKDSKYEKERVEAWFHMAQCYWYSKQGGKAREACYQAVLSNPDHKAVLNFMSEIHNEPWKSKWKRIANNATNKDVMFEK